MKPGLTYGATDDFSYNAAENPVHVRDLRATILHLLGLDHERLTHRFQGLDFRLTGRRARAPCPRHPGMTELRVLGADG